MGSLAYHTDKSGIEKQRKMFHCVIASHEKYIPCIVYMNGIYIKRPSRVSGIQPQSRVN